MADVDGLARVRSLGWGVEIDAVGLAGSASGAGVYRVQVDGSDAVLKVTGAGGGQRNARRELTFYRTLADRVPVRTPRLLRYADNDDFTALLLSAHTPARPAREWDRSAWLEVARQLAALHSIPPPDEDPWTDTPWLRQVLDRPPIGFAEDYWSGTDAADSVGLVLDASGALAEAVRATPDSFLHGDCHADNLLREGGQLVWADWQASGVGSPAGELAFLWSRADADGADLPYDAMLREYVTHREADPALLRRSLVAAEIGILLFGWPHYAARLTQNERDRLTHRLLQLIDDWHTETAQGRQQPGISCG
jgi:thiamine kinase-like enzyme